ncbi:apolipoprotein L6 isoform X2 [Nycticebus coucang]|uniref:apolipoprotein L6 isoform X2 n=1 Tax=Nycticebus coucang TaxID=9470 RepID=UPI00234DBF4D|nr:apolipoprotein L6 isoform X2 [Nycticebus coucang]
MDLVLQEPVDNETGKESKAGIGLQRDVDDAPPSEDEEPEEEELSAEERIFLRESPRWKQDLEVNIRKLHALAEDVDATHKTFTKTSLVANSIAVVSGVMSILGLALAPATGGGSLLLSSASQGLGAAAGVTSILTSMLERSHNKKAQDRATNLGVILDTEAGEAGADKAYYVVEAGKITYNCGNTIRNIKKNLHVLQKARANPRLANAAKRLMTTGQVSARRSRQVQKAFGGTTLAMTKNARMLGGAMGALSLGLDLAAVSKDWKELKEGARMELAEELRAQARKLETKLTELTQQYESLQQRP